MSFLVDLWYRCFEVLFLLLPAMRGPRVSFGGFSFREVNLLFALLVKEPGEDPRDSLPILLPDSKE